MRRNIETDFEFNKEDFAKVLKSAIGARSYSAFAKEADLSFGYISKYMNLKADNAPTLATIKKMAKVSEGATYEELLLAGGYDPIKYISEEEIEATSPSAVAMGPMNLLLVTLMKVKFPWTMASVQNGGPIAISVEDAPFKMWYFIPTSKESISKEDILAILGSKEAENIKPNSKVTFLTSSKATYEQLEKVELNLLSLRVSVAYINPADGLVDKERYLKTAIELTEEEKTYYIMTNEGDSAPAPLSL